jgi:hypothetical protein
MRLRTNYTEDTIRKSFKDAYIDHDQIVRWMSNDQIPFQDMLSDFRALGLIDEDIQLGSSLLREKEDEEFWADQQSSVTPIARKIHHI